MIRSAQRLRVDHEQTAFFARPDDQFPLLVGEDDRRDIHIEVALPQPLGVRRRVPVLELQLFGRERHDRVRVAVHRRLVLPVAGFGIHRPVLADRRTRDAPQPAAARSPVADRFRRIAEIERVDAVGIAAAALTGNGVDDVVVIREAVRLAIGRQELHRRHHLLAGVDIHLMEIPIAGEHENRSNRERTAAALRPGGCRRGLAAGLWCRRSGRGRTTSTGWRRRQHRPCGQTARTEKRRLIALLRFGLPVEVSLPEHRAEVGIDRDEIVGGGRDKRQFLETSIGDGALENERAEQRIDGPLLRVDLHLPQQPQVVERLFRDLRFIALPAVTQVAAAVRHPLGASERHDHDACDEHGPHDQSSHETVLNTDRDRFLRQ